MKSHQLILLVLLSILTFSCVDNLSDYGSGIQPPSDAISIGTDTIHLATQDSLVDYIVARSDSFLLGSFYNSKFGTTQADILAQVNCPLDFKFTPFSVPDSALVVLYYKSWYGDKYSPLDVNVYEMNLNTFSYTGKYQSNLNPTDYTDRSILLGRRIFSAKKPVKDADSASNYITIKLSTDFVHHFFNDTHYGSETDFTNFFKGIYITTNFGASTILNVSRIDLQYYCHYTYTKPGADTLTTVKNVIPFPANKEVRQVNRFLHPDRNEVLKQKDSVNHVASPANVLTKIALPLSRIKQKIDAKIASNKKKILNKAILSINATEVADTTLEMPLVQYMLLIKESYVQYFFDNNVIPVTNDKNVLLAQISATQIGTTGKYQYSYNFDLAALIGNELKNTTSLPENLKMVLIPVSIKTATSSSGGTSISAVKQQYLMSGVTIRSGKVINPLGGDKVTEPMHLKLIYTGF